MRAIRVQPKGRGERPKIHALTDDELTVCGRNVDDLDVLEDLDVDEFPPVEGCGNCRRNVNGWMKPKPTIPEPYYRTVAPASAGRISKAGKLRQTGESGHGSRLI